MKLSERINLAHHLLQEIERGVEVEINRSHIFDILEGVREELEEVGA